MWSKYRAKKTTVDGIRFDSQKEAARYCELKRFEQIGEIERLELQPKFELLPPFVYDGKKIRGIVYRADFAYYRGGIKYIEDVKGFKTKEYQIKKKYLLYNISQSSEKIIFIET